MITEGEGGLEEVIEGVSIDFTDSILEEDYTILAPTQCRVSTRLGHALFAVG